MSFHYSDYFPRGNNIESAQGICGLVGSRLYFYGYHDENSSPISVRVIPSESSIFPENSRLFSHRIKTFVEVIVSGEKVKMNVNSAVKRLKLIRLH